MLKRSHVLRTQEFEKGWVERIFDHADTLKKFIVQKNYERLSLQLGDSHKSVLLAFYEASTRTVGSFDVSANLLGLRVRNPGNMKAFSSAVKGETLEDTIRVFCGQRPDIIVLRHDEGGAASRAAVVANDFERETGHQAYIINAGDGPFQHPTQALLDLYTLREKFGSTENMKIVFGGDLRYGRTIRSLVYLLAKFDEPEFLFVSMPELTLSPDILQYLDQRQIAYQQVSDLDAALEIGAHYHAWYWTRSQTERIENDDIRKKEEIIKLIKDAAPRYDLHHKHFERMGKDTIVMHPLPRVNEIQRECDADSRAWYFRQSDNGVPVRMALYEYLCGVFE